MDKTTVEKLLALNREFYAVFAQPFAASRPVADPALTCILSCVPQRARVLDVGCGNGRLALLLDRERPGTTYVGVDAVPELIEVACAETAALENVATQFHAADIARPGWSGELHHHRGTEDTEKPPIFRGKPSALCDAGQDLRALCVSVVRFDCVACVAVLHHIPSFNLRLRVLREIADLLEPDGVLILSTWQFLESDRMRRKIVDWVEVGIPEGALEPGDYLLDWKREGRGLRYCHLVDGAEVERLAAGSGLRVRETFRAGGREGNLSLFAVLDKLSA